MARNSRRSTAEASAGRRSNRSTAPTGRPGEETIALQVGKYIADGVIITLSQSADNSSPNIAVEVDLSHGFVFEAENDQVQEQGRFSLMWNRNY